MDYHTLHGRDLTNFSSSPHRMPTVSAAEALEDLQSSSARTIATGLKGLDLALLGKDGRRDGEGGGVERGKVTEVYGPPGVGKTVLGIQLAAAVIAKGEAVVWVDAANPLPGPRLLQVLSSHIEPIHGTASSPPNTRACTDLLSNLTLFSTPTLPHLLALLCHNAPSFPPPSTDLIVVDSLSSLFTSTYPRNLDNSSPPRKPGRAPKPDSRHWAASRKWPVLQHLIASLQKLATLCNLAVVVLNQSVTRMQPGAGAALVPAVASAAWDAGIATRVVLFRDWGWDSSEVRFAQVIKGGSERVIGFVVYDGGLKEVFLPEAAELEGTGPIDTPLLSSKKRKADEIRDSEEEGDLEDEDEDYGWAEEDEGQLPDPPSQWLGSEDILLPGPAEDEEEEAAEERSETDEEDEIEPQKNGDTREHR